MRAATVWCPKGVLIRESAAHIWGLGDAPAIVSMAVDGRVRNHPRVSMVSRSIGTEHRIVRDGMQVTLPAYTAVDLASVDRGQTIDEALRRRLVTVPHLLDALSAMAGSPGQTSRRRLVLDSRTNPWSQAERLLHHHLRSARISGWVANARVVVDGQNLYPDVLFRGQQLVLEADGWAHHGVAEFENDRIRQNQLVLAGYRVLRFTWHMLQSREGVLKAVRDGLGL